MSILKVNLLEVPKIEEYEFLNPVYEVAPKIIHDPEPHPDDMTLSEGYDFCPRCGCLHNLKTEVCWCWIQI